MTKRIAICGAGISGLTLAYQLQQQGHQVTVFEAASRAGGVVDTITRQGFRLETGPHTLLVRHQAVADLLHDLDLDDQIRAASEAASTRYIVRDGRPVALPRSPAEALTTPLLTPAARLRLLAEPLVGRFDKPGVDETLARFISRRLGPEALAYLVDPFVGGIFAGNPHHLSAKHTFPALVELEKSAGSIALGALKSVLDRRLGDDDSPRVERQLISFDQGMKTLVDALQDRLGPALKLDHPVRKLRRDDHSWRVIYERGKARRGQSFDAVVVTLPTHQLSSLEWEGRRPPQGVLSELATLPYAPCDVVSLGYERRQVAHDLDGFGMLVPGAENFHILGTLFVSSMFERRAPEDQVLLTAFIGGARQPELTAGDDATLRDMAHLDASRLLGIDGRPQFTQITRWPQAIPQYEVGHDVYLSRLSTLEDALPGVFFAGNYRTGPGLPDIICESAAFPQIIDDFFAHSSN